MARRGPWRPPLRRTFVGEDLALPDPHQPGTHGRRARAAKRAARRRRTGRTVRRIGCVGRAAGALGRCGGRSSRRWQAGWTRSANVSPACPRRNVRSSSCAISKASTAPRCATCSAFHLGINESCCTAPEPVCGACWRRSWEEAELMFFRRRRRALVCRDAVALMTDYLEGAAHIVGPRPSGGPPRDVPALHRILRPDPRDDRRRRSSRTRRSVRRRPRRPRCPLPPLARDLSHWRHSAASRVTRASMLGTVRAATSDGREGEQQCSCK